MIFDFKRYALFTTLFFNFWGVKSFCSQENSVFAPQDMWVKASTPPQRERLELFFQGTLKKLPQALQRSLQGKVQFGFQLLGSASLQRPLCGFSGRSTFRDQFETISGDFVDAKRVESNLSTTAKPLYIINLNSIFYSVILQGQKSATTYVCGHKNLYKYVEGVIVKEMARLYDDLNFTAINNEKEKAFRIQCQYTSGPVPVHQMSEECRQVLSWQHSLSDRPQWRDLRHKPESTEAQDLQNDFIRHVEFYSLDPEFSCRKPAVNAFLNRYFGGSNGGECEPNSELPVNLTGEKVQLDTKRLYQIHLLVADPGENMESRWGHIMFRLVFCSAQRAEVGPDCLQDLNEHVVVGFLGAPGTILTSNWDGFVGKYPSILTVQPFSQAMNEYSIKESRTLTSVPLNLSESEKSAFVNRTLEDFWIYQGRYLFFTNNCATEALHFLSGVVQKGRMALSSRDILVETPTSFYKFLVKKGFADDSKKIVFASPRQKWRKDTGKNLLENLILMSAEQRLGLYEIKKMTDDQANKKIAIAFYEAELEIYARLKAAKDQVLQSFVAQDLSQMQGDYIPLVQDLQNQFSKLSPKNLVRIGYGVPLMQDYVSEAQVNLIRKGLSDILSKIEVLLKRDRPEIYQALTDSNSNMKYFYQDIKKAKKAGN